jgi:hypothetical protein
MLVETNIIFKSQSTSGSVMYDNNLIKRLILQLYAENKASAILL